MNVVFFRHGPAVPHGTAGVSDADRPLTPEGRKKTAQAAKGLRALDLEVDAIYTSPLPRALQTAEILGETLKLKVEVLEALRTGVAPRRLIAGLAGLKSKTPVLVGHEPQLSAAVSLAICGSDRAVLQLKKAGLAFVGFDGPSTATLKLLLTGSALRRAAARR